MNLIVSLVAMMLLSGCASTYVSPKKGDLAFISTNSLGVEYSFGFSSYSVMVGTYDDEGCLDGANKVEDETLDSNGYFAVTAGEPVLLYVGRTVRNTICPLKLIKTTLEQNELYSLDYMLIDKFCVVKLNKIVQGGAEDPIEEVKFDVIEVSFGDKVCK